MKTVTMLLREHLQGVVGVVDRVKPYEEILKTEWNPLFEKLMRNRLVLGFFRYGEMHGTTKTTDDRIKYLAYKVSLYKDTGNLEHLVDLANVAMVEFSQGTHPNKHFGAEDDRAHIGAMNESTTNNKPRR